MNRFTRGINRRTDAFVSGRFVVVKLLAQGVTMKLEGERWSSAVNVLWRELYSREARRRRGPRRLRPEFKWPGGAKRWGVARKAEEE